MMQRVIDHMTRAGAVRHQGELRLGAHKLEATLAPSGAVAIDVQWRGVAGLSGRALCSLLRRSPEAGWCWAVSSDGELVQRVLMPPIVWVNETVLHARISALNERQPSHAAVVEPMLPLLPAVLPDAADVEAGVALWLLLQNGAGFEPVQRLLPREQDVWGALAAGDDPAAVEQVIAADARVLEAFLARPDAAARLAAAYGVRSDGTPFDF